MHSLAVVIAFVLGTIDYAFAQLPPLILITQQKVTCNPVKQRRASLSQGKDRAAQRTDLSRKGRCRA